MNLFIMSQERQGSNNNENEDALIQTLQRFKVFSGEEPPTSLQDITTKNLATEAIQDTPSNAKILGQVQLDSFMEKLPVKLVEL